MPKPARLGTVLAVAAALSLTGCSSTDSSPSEGTTQTPANAAPATAAPAAAESSSDPLDNIPDVPFDKDPAVTLEWVSQKELGADQDGVDLTGALKTVSQVAWVGAQRDTVVNGWKPATVAGYLRDIEHFVAPAAQPEYLVPAKDALVHAEANEAGTAEELPEGTGWSYLLYPGFIAQGGEGASSPEDEAAWPEYADSNSDDTVIWFNIPDEGRIPVLKGAKAEPESFSIDSITDLPGEADPAHTVVIKAFQSFRVPLADGRTSRLSAFQTYQVGLEGDKWLIQDSSWETGGIVVMDPAELASS